MTERVYRRVVYAWMRAQEPPVDLIAPIGYDHNVCRTCELHKATIAEADKEIAAIDLQIEKLEAEKKRLE